MRSAASRVVALLMSGVAAGCVPAAVESIQPSRASTPSPSSPQSVAASAEPSVAEPGQPFTAEMLLDAMRTSRRPGGVPEEVQTAAVAGAMAQLLWTADGAPPDDMAISGACGGAACTVELVAVRDDADGEDIWRFSVDPETGAVATTSAELGAVPEAIHSRLDAIARSAVGDSALDGMILTATRWHPPPTQTEVDLLYRTGDEEGSCSIDLTLELSTSEVSGLTRTGCE